MTVGRLFAAKVARFRRIPPPPQPQFNESVSNLISFSDAPRRREGAGAPVISRLLRNVAAAAHATCPLSDRRTVYLSSQPTNDRPLLLLLLDSTRKLIAVIDDPLFRGKVDSDHEAE